MPSSLRIDRCLCDIIPKAQSWLVLNLPVFMCLHSFNVPSTRITDLVRMYQMKRFIIGMEPSPLSMFLLFNLVCVQSVIQLMNTPFTTFVL